MTDDLENYSLIGQYVLIAIVITVGVILAITFIYGGIITYMECKNRRIERERKALADQENRDENQNQELIEVV